MGKQINGRLLTGGATQGKSIVTNQAISFWGGLNPTTGEIVDRRHELSGENVSGRIFVFPREKGSSTGSAVLLESIRNKVAPAAIITKETPPVLALGAIIAEELYQTTIPILVVSEEDFDTIPDGADLSIEADASLYID